MTATGNEDTRAPVSTFGGGEGHRQSLYHSVQFYADDAVLCDAVLGFVGPGLLAGDAVVVVATERHRTLFDGRLTEMGFDIAGARASGQLTTYDAHETLGELLVDAMPDADCLKRLVTATLAQGARWGHVRVYGEMVDILWKNGNPEAALALETMWTDLQERHDFSLLCSYQSSGFADLGDGLLRVCALHDD